MTWLDGGRRRTVPSVAVLAAAPCRSSPGGRVRRWLGRAAAVARRGRAGARRRARESPWRRSSPVVDACAGRRAARSQQATYRDARCGLAPTGTGRRVRRGAAERASHELGKEITADYAGRAPLLVGVLKGAFMFMSDLSRAIDLPVEFDFMAVSSYGSATRSSGVVRIIKDLDLDLTDRHVMIVEDIVDSGPHARVPPPEPRGPRPGVARGVRAAGEGGPAAGRARPRATSGSRIPPDVRGRVRPRRRRAVPQPASIVEYQPTRTA